MSGGIEFSGGKLKELVLYLSQQSLQPARRDTGFGYVKLNKLLYRADTEAYRRLGHSITGETYEKREYGPVGSHVPIVLDELGATGYLTWELLERGGHTQKIPTAIEPPDLSSFTEAELEIANDVLAELLPYGGRAVSEWSHRESAGWNLVDEGAEIPYGTTFISTEPIPPEDIDRARELAIDRGWASIHP